MTSHCCQVAAAAAAARGKSHDPLNAEGCWAPTENSSTHTDRRTSIDVH